MHAMKKLVQGALLPFVIFTSGILLLGCEPSPEQSNYQNSNAKASSEQGHSDHENQTDVTQTQSELKSGNMFYIARDVADVQFKAGGYVEKLTQAQADLQNAIESKDQNELQNTVKTLSQELQGFNKALISLDLKSQEIDDIRQHVLQSNKELLNSALLNGNIDVSKINIKQFEQQVGNIQTEMLKLAAMLIPTADANSTKE